MAKHAHAIKPQLVPPMPKAPRHINCHHTAGNPCATPDAQTLSKSAPDQAQWGSTERRAFTIDFNSRSPFAESVFHVPAGGGLVSSGPITGEPGIYKYSLVNDRGQRKDPTIIVEE